MFQVTSPLAAVRHHLRPARGGELRWHGVQYRHPVHDAPVRHHVHRLLPLEDEQGARLLHVPAVLRVCGRKPWLRVRVPGLPRVVGRKAAPYKAINFII